MYFRTRRQFFDYQDNRKEYKEGDLFESSNRMRIDRLVIGGYIDKLPMDAPNEPKKKGRKPNIEIPFPEKKRVERATSI